MRDCHGRRRVLRAGAALCGLGLAGCLDVGDSTDDGAGSDDAAGTETGDDTESTGTGSDVDGNDSDGGGGDGDGADGDSDADGSDPGGDPEPEPVTEWPMQQYDARNTGAVPDAAAPTEDVGELWREEFDARIDASPVVADGAVYVGDRDGVVHAIDAESGDELWTASVSGSVRATAAVHDDLLLVPHEGGVTAFDRDGNGEMWSSDPTAGATDLTVSDGRVVFGDTRDSLYCLDADNGDEEWVHEGDQGPEEFTEAPAIYDGEVIVPDGWRELIGVDLETSDKRTIADTGGEYGYRSPVSVSEDGVAFVGTSVGVQALEDFEEGFASERWHYTTDYPVEAGLAVTEDFVYGMSVDDFDGILHQLSVEDGDEQWSEAASNGKFSGPLVVDDLVSFGDGEQRVVAFDRFEDTVVWEVDAPLGLFEHGTFTDGRFYFIVSGENTTLQAIA